MLWFDERACRARIAEMRSEGIYTPPSREGTLMLPGYPGGINWGGIALDPESQTAVAFANDAPFTVTLIPRERFDPQAAQAAHPDAEIAAMRETPYAMRREAMLSPLGMPCIEPPWGRLVAMDMGDGSIRWSRGIGTIEDVAPAPVPNLELGTPGMGGPIVTAGGLVFIGATMDDYLRAFDLANGEELWRGRLPAGGQATPMTFRGADGRQYVVIAAGGHPGLGTTPGDYLVAFSLPQP